MRWKNCVRIRKETEGRGNGMNRKKGKSIIFLDVIGFFLVGFFNRK
jgi:hypothetical protein